MRRPLQAKLLQLALSHLVEDSRSACRPWPADRRSHLLFQPYCLPRTRPIESLAPDC